MSRKARIKEGNVSRRSFVKLLSAVTAGAIAMPDKSEAFNLDEFLQKHFHELSDEEMKKTLERLTRQYNEKYDREDALIYCDPPYLPETRHGSRAKTYGVAVALYGAVPRAGGNEMGGYQIDQNNNNPTAGESLPSSAGLCTLCHGKTIDSLDKTTDAQNLWIGTNDGLFQVLYQTWIEEYWIGINHGIHN